MKYSSSMRKIKENTKRTLLVVVGILLLFGLFPTLTTPIYAANCDQQFYSSNDVLFYNPCANACGPVGSGAAASALRGSNNAEKIFNYWLDSGMSAQQAAGIAGSIKHESGFSPFRQEMSQTWPAGGWGIAQFTHDPGQRGSATKWVREEIGEDLFTQYYKNDYGGAVFESNGFIPDGVPTDVNDKFLFAELNYLLDHIKQLIPNNIRTGGLSADYGQNIPPDQNLYDYLRTLVQADAVAIAWTYLYEYPGDIKNTAAARGTSASEILTLYGGGISTSCGGGLTAGGMSLDQAKEFMAAYKNNPDNRQYIGGAGTDCPGGPLANCVSFSTYFINKYTNLEGFASGAPGHGKSVAGNVVARNPTVQSGHSPRPYAIFSLTSGEYGHTGVILAVDTDRQIVIAGEASCGDSNDWTDAREYPLSKFDSDAYTYAYTDGFLKEGL